VCFWAAVVAGKFKLKLSKQVTLEVGELQSSDQFTDKKNVCLF